MTADLELWLRGLFCLHLTWHYATVGRRRCNQCGRLLDKKAIRSQ